MTSVVSLWSNLMDGEYDDKKIFETEKIIVVRYCGQKTGKFDKHIGVGNYFFFKNKKKDNYKFAGKVICSNLIGIETQLHNNRYHNVNIFELVISKETQISFRIKDDAYRYFGWKKIGQEQLNGIVKNTLLQ